MVLQHSLVPSAASQPEPRQSAWHSLHLRGQSHRRLLRWCRGGLSTLPRLCPGLRIRGELNDSWSVSWIMMAIIFPVNIIAIEGQGSLTSLKSMNNLFLGTDQWIVRLEPGFGTLQTLIMSLKRPQCHEMNLIITYGCPRGFETETRVLRKGIINIIMDKATTMRRFVNLATNNRTQSFFRKKLCKYPAKNCFLSEHTLAQATRESYFIWDWKKFQRVIVNSWLRANKLSRLKQSPSLAPLNTIEFDRNYSHLKICKIKVHLVFGCCRFE